MKIWYLIAAVFKTNPTRPQNKNKNLVWTITSLCIRKGTFSLKMDMGHCIFIKSAVTGPVCFLIYVFYDTRHIYYFCFWVPFSLHCSGWSWNFWTKLSASASPDSWGYRCTPLCIVWHFLQCMIFLQKVLEWIFFNIFS